MITLAFDHSIARTGWYLSEPPSPTPRIIAANGSGGFVDQNARLSGGFNESGMCVDRRFLSVQDFEACFNCGSVTSASTRPADVQQGLCCASRAVDRPDYSKLYLDRLYKSFVGHFSLPLLGELNLWTAPMFRKHG
jgi:hypothetical protein